MTSTKEANQDCRPPSAIGTHGLSKQTQYREASEDEHRTHTTQIGVHTLLVDEVGRQIATTDRQDGYDSIEREDKGDTHSRVRGVAILIAEISRSPEQEEPPDTISHELTHKERPRLFVGETLEERNGLLFLHIVTILSLSDIVVLLNVVELSLIDTLVLSGFVVEPSPQTHPNET